MAKIINKVCQEPNAFAKFENKIKNYEEAQSCTDLIFKKYNQVI